MNLKIPILLFASGFAFAADPIVTPPVKDAVPAPVTAYKIGAQAFVHPPHGFSKSMGADQDALLLLDDEKPDHGELATKFKTLNTDDEQVAGLVCRYQDPQNYFVVLASAKDDDCSLYRVKKGKRKLLDTQQVVVTPMIMHELRLVFAKGTYTVLLDGEAALGGKNSSFDGAGLVGLWTSAGSAALFNDFRVTH
jgi:hypothetical protein